MKIDKKENNIVEVYEESQIVSKEQKSCNSCDFVLPKKLDRGICPNCFRRN